MRWDRDGGRERRAEAQSAVHIKDITNISLSVLILWCWGGEKLTCVSQEPVTLEPNVGPLKRMHPDLVWWSI